MHPHRTAVTQPLAGHVLVFAFLLVAIWLTSSFVSSLAWAPTSWHPPLSRAASAQPLARSWMRATVFFSSDKQAPSRSCVQDGVGRNASGAGGGADPVQLANAREDARKARAEAKDLELKFDLMTTHNSTHKSLFVRSGFLSEAKSFLYFKKYDSISLTRRA